jgi:hypothetical protein
VSASTMLPTDRNLRIATSPSGDEHYRARAEGHEAQVVELVRG